MFWLFWLVGCWTKSSFKSRFVQVTLRLQVNWQSSRNLPVLLPWWGDTQKSPRVHLWVSRREAQKSQRAKWRNNKRLSELLKISGVFGRRVMRRWGKEEGTDDEEESKEARGGGAALNMWRQLFEAKQQSMTQQKPPQLYVRLNEHRSIDTGRVSMCSEAAAAASAALLGCCWPQTVSAPKENHTFRCIPLFSVSVSL